MDYYDFIAICNAIFAVMYCRDESKMGKFLFAGNLLAVLIYILAKFMGVR